LELPDGKGVLTEPVCALCGEGAGNSLLCPRCDRRFCSAPCFGVHLKAVDDERDLAPLPEAPTHPSATTDTIPVCYRCGMASLPTNTIMLGRCDTCHRWYCGACGCSCHATKAPAEEAKSVPSLATLRPLSAATTPALLLHRLSYVTKLRETRPLDRALTDITSGPLPPLQHGVRQLDRKAFATWSIARLRRLPKVERDARITAWFKLLVEDLPPQVLQRVYATAQETTLAGTVAAFQRAPEHWYTVLAGLGLDPDCGVCGEASEVVEIAGCAACGWEDVRRCPRCASKRDAVYNLPIGQKTLKLHRVVCKK
jgi:hypothetical protein